MLNSLLAQQETSINAIKKIRLDNLKKNYLDQTIRFYIPGKISVIGELRDITESNLLLGVKMGPCLIAIKTLIMFLLIQLLKT